LWGSEQCWLKSSVEAAVWDGNAVCGTVGPNPGCEVHPKYNHHGDNIGSYHRTSNAEQCCGKCKAEPDCVGWTFVNGNSHCYLKSRTDELRYEGPEVVSGFIRKSGGHHLFGASAANETFEASNVTSSTTSIMPALAVFVLILHHVLLF